MPIFTTTRPWDRIFPWICPRGPSERPATKPPSSGWAAKGSFAPTATRRRLTADQQGWSIWASTSFESARAYSGSEAYYGRALGEGRKEIFLASKSHGRDRDGRPRTTWPTTLRNMKTDHLDLWQVHDVRTEAEIEEIFGPGGAIEALFGSTGEKGRPRARRGDRSPRSPGPSGLASRVRLRHRAPSVNPAEPSHRSSSSRPSPWPRKREWGSSP